MQSLDGMLSLLKIIAQIDTNYTEHLFHGTILPWKESILSFGLAPQVGPFVSDVYEDAVDQLQEYTFAADLDGLNKCAAAIVGQIASEYKDGDYKNVDEEDIKEYGILFVLEYGKTNEIMDYRPKTLSDWDDTEYPTGIEPGDYYSTDHIEVDSYIEGQALVDLFNQYNILDPLFREIYLNY